MTNSLAQESEITHYGLLCTHRLLELTAQNIATKVNTTLNSIGDTCITGDTSQPSKTIAQTILAYTKTSVQVSIISSVCLLVLPARGIMGAIPFRHRNGIIGRMRHCYASIVDRIAYMTQDMRRAQQDNDTEAPTT